MDDIAKILAELAQLHDAGKLTDSEYSAAKKEALTERTPPLERATTPDPIVPPETGAADSGWKRWNWKRISNFRSRTSRSEFWATMAIAMGATFVLGVVDGLLFRESSGVFMVAAFLLWVWLFWGASVNRLHDLGMHGWWALTMLVPLLGLWFFVLIAFKKGDPGSNRWGRPIGSAAAAPKTESKRASDPIASDGIYAFGEASGTGTSRAPSGRAKQLGVVAGVVVVIAAALGVYVVATNGGAESRRAAPRITASTVAPGIGTTTTDPRNGESTSTLSAVAMTGFDAQVRDFLMVVDELEANDRYVQASDGENWYLWVDEYTDLAAEYLDLAELWDRTYAARADRAESGFGQMVSHALILRSDGYRLAFQASTPEAINLDNDSWYFKVGADATEEASTIFADVYRGIPEQWQADAGIAGSALDEVTNAEFVKPDLIPVFKFVVGDCYERPDESVYNVDRVDCLAGGDEVVWIQDIGQDFEGFPGEEFVETYAEELCTGRADERFPFSSALDGGTRWWAPNAELWSSGDTTVTCVLEV